MLAAVKLKIIKIIIDFFISNIYSSNKQKKHSNVPLCSLVSSKMVRNFICSVITCEFYCKKSFSLHIFDDGTLTLSDKNYLRSVFPKVKIIDPNQTKQIWKRLKEKFPWLYKLRFDSQVTPVRKKIDMLVFEKLDRMIMMDTDTLFFNEPAEIINFIKTLNSQPLYSVWSQKADDLEQVVREMISERFKLKISSAFNSGLLVFSKSKDISLRKMNDACEFFYKTGYAQISWLSEETAIQIAFNEKARALQPVSYLNTSNITQLRKSFSKNLTFVHYSGNSGLKIKMLFDFVHYFIPTYLKNRYKYDN